MGDKGGGGSPDPTPYQNPDSGDTNMMMMQMFSSMMEGMNEPAPQTPTPIQIPEVQRTAEVDWTEKMEQLTSKARADYTLDRARTQGRLDTIHTSPLLDDEDIATTGLL